MLTLILYVLLAVGLVGGLFMLAVRLLPAGEQIAPALRDEPLWGWSEQRPVSGADVEQIRLPVALRGYRFAEVDQLLDRLAQELRQRDQALAELRSGSADHAPAAAPGNEPEWEQPAAETGAEPEIAREPAFVAPPAAALVPAAIAPVDVDDAAPKRRWRKKRTQPEPVVAAAAVALGPSLAEPPVRPVRVVAPAVSPSWWRVPSNRPASQLPTVDGAVEEPVVEEPVIEEPVVEEPTAPAAVAFAEPPVAAAAEDVARRGWFRRRRAAESSLEVPVIPAGAAPREQEPAGAGVAEPSTAESLGVAPEAEMATALPDAPALETAADAAATIAAEQPAAEMPADEMPPDEAVPTVREAPDEARRRRRRRQREVPVGGGSTDAVPSETGDDAWWQHPDSLVDADEAIASEPEVAAVEHVALPADEEPRIEETAETAETAETTPEPAVAAEPTDQPDQPEQPDQPDQPEQPEQPEQLPASVARPRRRRRRSGADADVEGPAQPEEQLPVEAAGEPEPADAVPADAVPVVADDVTMPLPTAYALNVPGAGPVPTSAVESAGAAETPPGDQLESPESAPEPVSEPVSEPAEVHEHSVLSWRERRRRRRALVESGAAAEEQIDGPLATPWAEPASAPPAPVAPPEAAQVEPAAEAPEPEPAPEPAQAEAAPPAQDQAAVLPPPVAPEPSRPRERGRRRRKRSDPPLDVSAYLAPLPPVAPPPALPQSNPPPAAGRDSAAAQYAKQEPSAPKWWQAPPPVVPTSEPEPVAVDEPVAEEPVVVEEPIAEEPFVEEPVVEEPVVEEPFVEEPVVEEPVVEEPVAVQAEEEQAEEAQTEEEHPAEPPTRPVADWQPPPGFSLGTPPNRQ